MLLSFLLYVNVRVLVLSETELQKEKSSLDVDAEFPDIIPLLQATDGNGGGGTTTTFRSITYGEKTDQRTITTNGKTDPQTGLEVSEKDEDESLIFIFLDEEEDRKDLPVSIAHPKLARLGVEPAASSSIIFNKDIVGGKEIGRGGKGRIFQIEDSSTKKKRALKHVVVPLDLTIEEQKKLFHTVPEVKTGGADKVNVDKPITSWAVDSDNVYRDTLLTYFIQRVPLVVQALREAYVALDISSHEPHPACCVQTYGVYVAFSRTTQFRKRSSGAQYGDNQPIPLSSYRVHFIHEMELVQNGDFSQFLPPSIPIAVQWPILVGEFFRDAAKAVQEMHGLGWTHGDIKPENLLLTAPLKAQSDGDHAEKRPRLKLADYDLALPVKLHREKDTAGTPAYVDPEVECIGVADAIAADCWSVGATLYEIASFCWGNIDGKAPLDGKTEKLRQECGNWVKTKMLSGGIETTPFRPWWLGRNRAFARDDIIHKLPTGEPVLRENFPPPFNLQNHNAVRDQCTIGKSSFDCFISVLRAHAFNVQPGKRDLEKLVESLEAIKAKKYKEEALQLPSLSPPEAVIATKTPATPSNRPTTAPGGRRPAGRSSLKSSLTQTSQSSLVSDTTKTTSEDQDSSSRQQLDDASSVANHLNEASAVDHPSKKGKEAFGSVLEVDYTGNSAALHQEESAFSGAKNNEASVLEVDHTKKGASSAVAPTTSGNAASVIVDHTTDDPTKNSAFIQGQEDSSTSSGGKDTDNDKKTRKGKLRKIKKHDFSAFLELASFERATESVDATSESVEA
ncbi:unnamed protein product, partial [Amoebophrya sp. A25]